MMNEKRDEFEIDLQKLVQACLRKWWLFVVAAVIAGMLSFWYTACFVTPVYRASVTAYVNNIRRGEDITYISGTNLMAAQQLVATYIQIIGSDAVLARVAEEAELDLLPKDIRKIMSAKQVGETELFQVSVLHPDPVEAAKIANAIAEIAPQEIETYVAGTSAKIIDYAKVPESPASPSLAKNCVVGAMFGIMLVLAGVTLHFLFDVRIKSEEDLTSLFDIPVLGQIPVFVTEEPKRKSGHHGKNAHSNAAGQQKGGAK